MAEQLSVTHVHPAGLDAQAAVDLGADAKLRFEQQTTSEIDLVVSGILKIPGGAIVNRDPDAGANVNLPAEPRGQANSGIARLSRGIQCAEGIRLEWRVSYPPTAETN